jgi:hypothetical protein
MRVELAANFLAPAPTNGIPVTTTLFPLPLTPPNTSLFNGGDGREVDNARILNSTIPGGSGASIIAAFEMVGTVQVLQKLNSEMLLRLNVPFSSVAPTDSYVINMVTRPLNGGAQFGLLGGDVLLMAARVEIFGELKTIA